MQNFEHLTRAEKLELVALLEEKARRDKYRQAELLFPDDGELRRELYPKHMEFFEAGALHKERCFMAGNRTGKTVAAGYEIRCHLTGKYPNWWKGKRFERPNNWMAAGDTNASTRDIIQSKLVGTDLNDLGTGLIGKDDVADFDRKSGVPNGIEQLYVKHISGGTSVLKLRSYDQGRKIFQGSEEDGIWFDEECPQDVYSEALIRTMTTQGITMLTFTPLSGLTPLVVDFLKSAGQI